MALVEGATSRRSGGRAPQVHGIEGVRGPHRARRAAGPGRDRVRGAVAASVPTGEACFVHVRAEAGAVGGLVERSRSRRDLRGGRPGRALRPVVAIPQPWESRAASSRVGARPPGRRVDHTFAIRLRGARRGPRPVRPGTSWPEPGDGIRTPGRQREAHALLRERHPSTRGGPCSASHVEHPVDEPLRALRAGREPTLGAREPRGIDLGLVVDQVGRARRARGRPRRDGWSSRSCPSRSRAPRRTCARSPSPRPDGSASRSRCRRAGGPRSGGSARGGCR